MNLLKFISFVLGGTIFVMIISAVIFGLIYVLANLGGFPLVFIGGCVLAYVLLAFATNGFDIY